MNEDPDERLNRAENFILEATRLLGEQVARIRHLAEQRQDTSREEEQLREMQNVLGAVDPNSFGEASEGPKARKP